MFRESEKSAISASENIFFTAKASEDSEIERSGKLGRSRQVRLVERVANRNTNECLTTGQGFAILARRKLEFRRADRSTG